LLWGGDRAGVNGVAPVSPLALELCSRGLLLTIVAIVAIVAVLLAVVIVGDLLELFNARSLGLEEVVLSLRRDLGLDSRAALNNDWRHVGDIHLHAEASVVFVRELTRHEVPLRASAVDRRVLAVHEARVLLLVKHVSVGVVVGVLDLLPQSPL